MSAESVVPEPLVESDQEISDALVLLYKLPDEAIDSIRQAKTALGIEFTEAALHTGLVTQRELDSALDWVRRRGMNEGRSIIEEALRRRPNPNALVVWEGEKLNPGKQLILAHDPYSERSEAIRSLRTELLMRTNGRRGAAMFALLSPTSGEGRSQLSAELAIAFAQLGSRTLLVDADMRNPRQHLLFGAENTIGLAQALVDIKQHRVYGVNGVQHMTLMTAGTVPPNPLELLSGNRFDRLVTEWRRSYEFVVIDTPPAARFSDGFAIATVAGNVVVLGRTNSTSYSAMTEMRRKLDTTNAFVVGAVMSTF
jgi:receptor protein-tyrosine kinase